VFGGNRLDEGDEDENEDEEGAEEAEVAEVAEGRIRRPAAVIASKP
jgi:hypothetical protein